MNMWEVEVVWDEVMVFLGECAGAGLLACST